MNDNDRFHDYLAARAATIDLPHAAPSAVADRAARRRRHRHGAAVASVVAAFALVVGIVATRPEHKEQITAGVPAGAQLHWTVVEPKSGLAFTNATAIAAGAVYSLSTAPGPMALNDPTVSLRPTLYRSTNGSDWNAVALPDDLWASSLASGGDRLYAVGTAPAGGSIAAVVAASDDGGTTWTQTALPIDLAKYEAAFPGRVSVGSPSVARTKDGVVAALTVQAQPDLTTLLPGANPDGSGAWAWSADGVDVYSAIDKSIAAHHSWQDLGIGVEQVSLILGELHVFAAQGSQPFEEVPVPVHNGNGPTLLASNDGFTLLVSQWGQKDAGTDVLQSADGRMWTTDATSPIAGFVQGTGLLGGRPALVVGGNDGTTVLHVRRADGVWSVLDLASSAADAGGKGAYVSSVAFGPLGLAAAVGVPGPDGMPGPEYVVFSSDGTSLATIAVADYLDASGGSIAGVVVTADAVLVRTSEPTSDPTTVPHQRVLVGTPQ